MTVNPETLLGNKPRAAEHPLATWLYARFKPGSGRLTKDEAYRIGDELNTQLQRIRELEAAQR